MIVARREHVSLIIRGSKKHAKRAAARHGVSLNSCVAHGRDAQCFTACTPSTRTRVNEWYTEGGKVKRPRVSAPPGSLLYVGGSCLAAEQDGKGFRGPRCNYTLAKGTIGSRKFSGCFSTKGDAERAAGADQVAVLVPPPGVQLQGRRRRRKRK